MTDFLAMARAIRELAEGGGHTGATTATGSGDILEKHDQLRVAWGWASVIEEGGIEVIDSQGDIISEAELLQAAHSFMRDHRAGKVLHKGEVVAEVVESVVLTQALQQALGIALGRVGWVIGMRVLDEAVWKRVMTGELKAFSFGGTGIRDAA